MSCAREPLHLSPNTSRYFVNGLDTNRHPLREKPTGEQWAFFSVLNRYIRRKGTGGTTGQAKG